MQHDDYYDHDGEYKAAGNDDDDIFFKWYEGYKKRKAQKAKIEEELMRIPCHPSR